MDTDSKSQEILLSIFYGDNNTSNISPIIKNPKAISSLLQYLFDSNSPANGKTFIINHLTKSFELIPFNAEVFQRITIENQMNLLKIAVHLYLHEESLQKVLTNLINYIITNVTCDINIFRYTHDFIKQYMLLENDTYDITVIKNKTKPKLTQKQFLSYLHLLQLLFCQSSVSPRKPNNYFYFLNTGMLIIHNDESLGTKALKVTNEDSLNFVIWIRLELSPEERKKYFNGQSFNLFKLDCPENNFLAQINENNELITNTKIQPFELKHRQWYCLLFQAIKGDKPNELNINTYINLQHISETKVTDVKLDQFNSVTFFQNFIGECTSILIFHTKQQQSPVLLLKDNTIPIFELGIYNEEIISPLIYNSTAQLYYNLNLTEEQKASIRPCNQLSRNLVACFIPTRFELFGEEDLFILCDFKSGLKGQIKDERKTDNGIKGIHVYTASHENIDHVGGVVSLLPIIELLTNLEKYNESIEKDVLCKSTVEEFIGLFWGLMSAKRNLMDAQYNNFFYCLSLFMEKISKEYFETAIDGFRQISFSCVNSGITNLVQEFYKHIFFNTTLLLKADYKVLDKVWEHLQIQSYKFLYCFSLANWCDLLIKYDSEHNESFCCQRHSSVFINKNDKTNSTSPNIMEPPLSTRMTLFREILIKGLTEESKTNKKVFITLIKLLTFEMSPCMQIFVLKLINTFASTHTSQLIENKKIVQDSFRHLIKNGITDVKLEVYNLMIWADKMENNCSFIKEQNEFILQNFKPILLPDNIGIVFNTEVFSKTLEDNVMFCLEHLSSNKNGYFILLPIFNLIKYCTLSYISLLFFKMNVDQHVQSSIPLTDYLLSPSKKLKDKFIDVVFEIYLLANNNKLNPKFKSSFTVNYTHSDEVIQRIQDIGIKHLVKTALKKIKIIEELLSWGKMQQVLLGPNESYQKILVSFLKTIFDQVIIQKFNKRKICVYSEKDKLELIAMFVWYYELATFFNFKLGDTEYKYNLFDLKIVDNKQLQGEFYDNLSILNEQLAIIIWDKDFKGMDPQKTFSTYIENSDKNKKNSYFYKEIKLMFSDVPNETSNQPDQSVINALTCFYMLLLQSLPNNETIFKEWLNKIFIYLHFLIISSSNLKKNKDDKLYNKFQSKVCDIIIITINTFVGEIEKRESNQNISNLVKDILKKLVFVCDKIYQLYKSEERDKQRKKSKIVDILVKAKNFILMDEDKTTYAVYNLFEKKGIGAYLSENSLKKKLEDKIERTRIFNHEVILNIRKSMIQGISVLFDLNKKIEINQFDTKKDLLFKLLHVKDKDNTPDSVVNITPIQSSLLDEINNAEIERIIQFNEKNQIYKRIKKNLFTFTNVWSYQKIFLENKHLIKHKRINHLTRDMTRIMFTPIIDIYTYIPKFSSFELENMFFTENTDKSPYVPYLADLSPADYSLVEEKDHLKIMENAKNKNPSFPMNIYYKYLSNISSKKEVPTDKTGKKIVNNNLQKVQTYLKNKYYTSTKIERCCFVKESYHIKGFFIVTPNIIHFYACPFENSNNIEEYDDERKTCFGSVFKQPKDCDKNCHIVIPKKDIDMFLKRRYNFRMKAIEIFTKRKKQYYFQFQNASICESVMAAIKKTFESPLKQLDLLSKTYNNYIGYSNVFDNVDPKLSIKEKYEQWKEWKISTLEFLMYANIYGNRSFIDLGQYPVAPWPIFDYSSPSIEITEESKNIIRDFSQPMGMQIYEGVPESKDRKESFMFYYENMLADKEEDPHHFGSHYSSPLYVAHYIDRIFPMAFLQIELQGSTFDDPNRLFFNIQQTSANTLSLKTDVRELVPEFFCTPEIFINYNEFNFGYYVNTKNEKEFRVDHVELPIWCKDYKDNDAYTFVYKFRKILENKEISYLIHEWFDIVFGSKLQSMEANNRFIKESSEAFERVFNALPDEEKNYAIRISEFGICPTQIFNSLIGGRKKLKDLNRKKPLNEISLTTETLREAMKIPLSIKLSKNGNKNILFQIFNNQLITYIISKRDNQSPFANQQEKESNKYTLERDKATSFKDISILKHFEEGEIPSLEMFNNSKTIVMGGFWSGELLLLDLNDESQKRKEFLYQNYEKTPFTCISINSFDSFIACGTKLGFVYIYKVSKSKQFKFFTLEEYTVLKHQKCEIVDIIINDNLNLLLTLSKNGYASVYTFPSCKLINYFYVHSNVNKCVISSSPLPSLLFLVNKRTTLKCFSINGKLLIEETMKGTIQHFQLFTGTEFTEHLICIIKNTDGNNLVEIRDLPYLQNDTSLTRPVFNSEILMMDVAKDGSFAVVLEKSKSGKKDEFTIIMNEKAQETPYI